MIKGTYYNTKLFMEYFFAPMMGFVAMVVALAFFVVAFDYLFRQGGMS